MYASLRLFHMRFVEMSSAGMLLLGTTLVVFRFHIHLDTADEFIGFGDLLKGLLHVFVQLRFFLIVDVIRVTGAG